MMRSDRDTLEGWAPTLPPHHYIAFYDVYPLPPALALYHEFTNSPGQTGKVNS